MAPKLTLLIDQPKLVYFPGQTITGRVQVAADKPIKGKTLSMVFSGAAWVKFAETHFEKQRRGRATYRRRTYGGAETYYEDQIVLWADASQEMAAGPRDFHFSYTLPSHAPSSFVGRYGQVVHSVVVTLGGAKARKDVTVVHPVSVNSVVDLNGDATLRMPQQCEKDKTLYCWCCRSEPLSVVVTLNKGGYVPGEFIIINADIMNKTKWTLSQSKVKLIMEVCYKPVGRSRVEMVALGKIVKSHAAAAAECNWSNEHLRLPPLPPSSLPGCNIIDIVYHLLFSVSFKGATSDLELKLPIVVGTIPTAVSGSLPTEPAYASGQSAAPPPLPGGCGGSEASQGLPLGLNLPVAPPTYQQATAAWGSEAMEDVRGVPASSEGGAAEETQASAPPATFLPFYVTYDFQDPSSPAVPQQSLLKPPVS